MGDKSVKKAKKFKIKFPTRYQRLHIIQNKILKLMKNHPMAFALFLPRLLHAMVHGVSQILNTTQRFITCGKRLRKIAL